MIPKLILKVMILMVFLMSITCTHNEENPPSIIQPELKPPHGMRLISSKSTSFIMGTDDPSFVSDERPAMPVSFTYDFYIDSTEVTQDEYVSIMKTDPVPSSTKYGKSPFNPVYYVSWFDAVLFCNGKSKKYHRDTVYTYNEVQKNTSGSVINLVGLRINYHSDGYRLPTEAEWEFTAKEGLKGKIYNDSVYSWYSVNSQGKTHLVASKNANSLGIYDMSGNLYEWTNDWKGMHAKKSITNPIGAATPNTGFERIVKGGAFLSDTIFTRPSARSTTYPTSVSASTEYIGFRCAVGIITNPAYVSDDTTVNKVTNPVDLVTSDIMKYTHKQNTRLVFVNVTGNLRTLCYVNYASTRPQIYEFKDRTDVYTPTISPDGRFVAYCSADEGMNLLVKSKVYIRSLDSTNAPIQVLADEPAFIPRWWVEPSTNDTFIIYTNSSIDCDLPEWKTTKTFIQKISNGKPVDKPITVVSDGSFHDGATPDGHYVVTGQSKLKMKHITNGTVKQLFTSPQNGKEKDGSDQVCNVSMCPDSSLYTYCMFLDFGYSGTSTLIKSSYGAHEYLFIGRYSGEIVRWIRCPPGEASWEHPEWSNQVNYAISAAESPNGNKKNIYLIKLNKENQDINRLVTGENLAHPYIWLSQGFSTPFDSACRYDLPPTFWHQEYITLKMAGFWKLYDSMEVVFAGTSHTTNGIDPKFFSRKVYNLAVSGCQMQEVFSIINNYVLNKCKKIKLISIDIIAGRFFFPEYSPLNLGLLCSSGYAFDKNHNFWKDSLPVDFTNNIAKLPLPENYENALKESLGAACQGWGGPNPPVESNNNHTLDDEEFTFNWNLLKTTADTLAKHNVHFLMIITPESPYYASTQSYGRQGPTKEVAHAIIDKIRELEKTNPFVHLYDANLDGNHDYTNADAYNYDHLCNEGAKKLSKRVDSLVTTILK